MLNEMLLDIEIETDNSAAVREVDLHQQTRGLCFYFVKSCSNFVKHFYIVFVTSLSSLSYFQISIKSYFLL